MNEFFRSTKFLDFWHENCFSESGSKGGFVPRVWMIARLRRDFWHFCVFFTKFQSSFPPHSEGRFSRLPGAVSVGSPPLIAPETSEKSTPSPSARVYSIFFLVFRCRTIRRDAQNGIVGTSWCSETMHLKLCSRTEPVLIAFLSKPAIRV